MRKMYAKGMAQFIPFAVTIIAILLTDLLMGILIGIAVGFFFVFKSNIHKSIVLVSEEKSFLIRFYKDVSFLQKPRLMQMLDSIPAGSSLLIDGSASVHIDADIEDLLEDFSSRAENLGIKLVLKKSSLALSALFKE